VPDPALPKTDGRRRVVIEGVSPEVDAGSFPAKRVVGEDVVVEADIFCDGHDVLGCVVRSRKAGDREWTETPMEFVHNDRWLRLVAKGLREEGRRRAGRRG
jgi:starch synthase (maltosyl-transferring)